MNDSLMDSSTFWQQVIALDVQYNSKRPFPSHFKLLYLKRRNQLFRNLARLDLNQFRKRYMKLRCDILEKNYGKSNIHTHIRNRSDSSFLSFIYDDLVASPEQKQRNTNYEDLTPDHLLQCQEESYCTESSNAFCENFSFSGVHHIFDQHKDAVNCIKFANINKSFLCSASSDGTLALYQLTPSPATILFQFRGHLAPVMWFDWSHHDDQIVSCSFDATIRLWSTKNGNCLRVFEDPEKEPITVCAFHPSNNNMIVTGNVKGNLNIVNLSIGVHSKNVVQVCDGQICSICFQSDGQLFWIGDCRGFITTFRFEMEDAKLINVSKVIIVAGCPITSLSISGDKLLLANCACNAVVLFSYQKIENSISFEFIKSFPIKHQARNLMIKSAFCPSSAQTTNQSVCIVTGSEDTTVYFYSYEMKKNRCVNRLQGHSATIMDVCFNRDESLFASADQKGNIIIWKRDQFLINFIKK